MLALWSLATKSRTSCNCHSCLNTVNKVARRGTNGFGRRRLGAGDLFTACYSTILGSAALLDAISKEDRKREWDRLITEVKGALQSDPANTQNDDSIAKAQAAEKRIDLSQSKNRQSVWTSPETRPERLPTPTVPLAAQLSILKSHVRESFHPPTATDIGIPLAGSQLDDMDGGFYPSREPTKPIHLDKAEEMVAWLVTSLLVRVKEHSVSLNGEDISSHMTSMHKRLEQYERRHTKLPEYSWVDENIVRTGRDELHNSLLSIGHSWTQNSNIELLVARMCYNLLICTAPPNITTLNLLLDIFTKWGAHHLGDLVIESFFERSRYKPNQRTIHLMLLHYTAKNDFEGFESIIKRMTAVDGKDLRIKKRFDCKGLEQINQDWIATRPVLLRQDYFLHEIFLPNAAVFDTMLRGYVKFKELWAAIRLAHNMLTHNVRIETDIFVKIVSDCIHAVEANHNAHLLKFCRLLLWKILHNHGTKTLHLTFTNLENDISLNQAIINLRRVCVHSPENHPGFWPRKLKARWRDIGYDLRLNVITHAIKMCSETITNWEETLHKRTFDLPPAVASITPKQGSEKGHSHIQISHNHLLYTERQILDLQRSITDIQASILAFSKMDDRERERSWYYGRPHPEMTDAACLRKARTDLVYLQNILGRPDAHNILVVRKEPSNLIRKFSSDHKRPVRIRKLIFNKEKSCPHMAKMLYYRGRVESDLQIAGNQLYEKAEILQSLRGSSAG